MGRVLANLISNGENILRGAKLARNDCHLYSIRKYFEEMAEWPGGQKKRGYTPSLLHVD